MAADGHVAFAEIGDAADDADQRGLAGAVRSQQRKYLAALDFQVDVIERLEAGAVDLRQVGDGDNRGHGGLDDLNWKCGQGKETSARLRAGEGRVPKDRHASANAQLLARKGCDS